MNPRYPKLFIYDLEVGKTVATVYDAYQTNVMEMFLHKYLLCFSYAWYDFEKAAKNPDYVPKVKTVSLADFPARFLNKPFDDYDVVKALHALKSQADLACSYNGRKFDEKVSNTRFTAHGLPAILDNDCKMIDPLLTVKRVLKLERNRLGDVCEHFGIKGKTKVTYGEVDAECSQLKNWWNREPIVLDKKAWKLMNAYCANDTAILYELYTKTRMLDTQHPNIDVWLQRDSCPTCGGTQFVSNGIRTTKTMRYRRLNCQGCGSPVKERLTDKDDKYRPMYAR